MSSILSSIFTYQHCGGPLNRAIHNGRRVLHSFHRIEIHTDHLRVHNWLDHRIQDHHHTMNHPVNWHECIDAARKKSTKNRMRLVGRTVTLCCACMFCCCRSHIDPLRRSWLDRRIRVPVSKLNFDHLGYFYEHIDSGCDKIRNRSIGILIIPTHINSQLTNIPKRLSLSIPLIEIRTVNACAHWMGQCP